MTNSVCARENVVSAVDSKMWLCDCSGFEAFDTIATLKGCESGDMADELHGLIQVDCNTSPHENTNANLLMHSTRKHGTEPVVGLNNKKLKAKRDLLVDAFHGLGVAEPGLPERQEPGVPSRKEKNFPAVVALGFTVSGVGFRVEAVVCRV